jgi:hypothetical protein
MTSTFNYLITKKRLLMMLKKTSPVKAGLHQAITIFFILILTFILSTKIVAQQADKVIENKREATGKQDTLPKIAWVGESIGYTEEGVSEELLKEYQNLVSKYFDTQESPSKQLDNITGEDRARMETIFKQMNRDQQSKQRVTFLKPPKPLPKVVPTKEQFSKFKNQKVYGVWIDTKKVANEVLNNYSHTDFSQVFSKLHGAAKKGRTYTHQLDLMTNDYYNKYHKEAIQNKRSGIVFRSPAKTRISYE